MLPVSAPEVQRQVCVPAGNPRVLCRGNGVQGFQDLFGAMTLKTGLESCLFRTITGVPANC